MIKKKKMKEKMWRGAGVDDSENGSKSNGVKQKNREEKEQTTAYTDLGRRKIV